MALRTFSRAARWSSPTVAKYSSIDLALILGFPAIARSRIIKFDAAIRPVFAMMRVVGARSVVITKIGLCRGAKASVLARAGSTNEDALATEGMNSSD